MEYSALIFDDCLDEQDTYEKMLQLIHMFSQDSRCRQVVVSCKSEWVLKLATCPKNKMMLVQKSDKPYVALLNGLKAVLHENVIVAGISKEHNENNVDQLLDELAKYPAIYLDDDFQAFDTRLLMFCLQHAIESNLAITSYAQAVSNLADTPLKYI
jgi:hypothetical protein